MERRLADDHWPATAATTADRHPTDRQVQTLAAVIATGSYGEAAATLGIRPRTVCNHLVGLRLRLGVETTLQAVYVLTARGVLVVPSVGRRAA